MSRQPEPDATVAETAAAPVAPATLYLVATPIGNLGDISSRAIEVLGAVDAIACEDTRHSGRLLQHLGLHGRRLFACHDHNEARSAAGIAAMLSQGASVALISDAGSPGIADPGFRVVRACLDAGHTVTTVPGPCAFVAAVQLSGLPVHAIAFRGFPPRKSGARRRQIAGDAGCEHTLVWYESCHRIAALVDDCLAVLGDRRAALVKDLTKLHERVLRGTLSIIAADLASRSPRGEYVLCISGSQGEAPPPPVWDAAEDDDDAGATEPEPSS